MSKMTDEQIINALKKYIECAENTQIARDVGGTLVISLLQNALDIINRQQAEIENLKADKIIAERHEKDARELYKDVVIQLKTAKSEAIKEFSERLEEQITTKIVELKTAKSKYIKENYKCLSCGYIAKIRREIDFLESLKEFINNLVKEMAGEGK